MNRKQRRALQLLPPTLAPWEVLVAPSPVAGQNQGLLIISDAQTGELRALGPLLPEESIWSVLGQAFLAPEAPGVPSRPRLLRCMDAALAGRLRRATKGLELKVEVVQTLPAAQVVLASLQANPPALAGAQAPGIDIETANWAKALEQLTDLAPWQRLSDSVTFRFRGSSALGTSVALLLGNAGEQRGVVLYPSEAIHLRFLDAARSGTYSRFDEMFALSLYLDTKEEFSPRELQACQDLGMVTSSGLFPRFMVMDKGLPRLPKPGEQLSMLAAVQAISALCKGSLVDLEVVPAAMPVRTQLGTIEVMSSPNPLHAAKPLFYDEYASYVGALLDPMTGKKVTALVLKLRKKQAQSLAKKLMGVDRLEVQTDCSLLAFAGQRLLGCLMAPDEEMIYKLHDKVQVTLCVSAGGPRRAGVKPKDFVMMELVQLGESELG